MFSQPQENLLPIKKIQEQPCGENHAALPNDRPVMAKDGQQAVKKDFGDIAKIEEPVSQIDGDLVHSNDLEIE